jgi:hypothetical protein
MRISYKMYHKVLMAQVAYLRHAGAMTEGLQAYKVYSVLLQYIRDRLQVIKCTDSAERSILPMRIHCPYVREGND